jgi:ribosome-associated toxin RatA of RatAB toxin-antitoxin module
LRRGAPALLALGAAFAGSTLAAGETVSVHAERRDDAFVVEAVAEFRADPRVAWQVLTDYDRYAEFIPDLRSSRVVGRSGAGAIVEQRGQAGFLFIRIPLEVRYLVEETPYRAVRSRAIGGDFREMEGVYELSPVPGGLRLAYSGRLVPGFMMPPLFGTMAVRLSVERQFGAMVREIVRRDAAAESARRGG